MSELEHLIENTLCNLEKNKSFDDIMQSIKKDINLENAGITAEQCYEICQYILYDYIGNNYKRIGGEAEKGQVEEEVILTGPIVVGDIPEPEDPVITVGDTKPAERHSPGKTFFASKG